MPTKKDYYEILGVPRDADEKAVKAAYRRLARKYHPDVNKGDKTSEERFKEVAEAFAVLSDTEKRQKYDSGGHGAFGAGFDPFAGYDPQQFDFGFGSSVLEDLLGQMFGGRASGRPGAGRPVADRGRDLRFETQISFMDAVNGATLELSVPRLTACSDCRGSGVGPGQGESACPQCGGTGRQARQQGGMRFAMACGLCGGSGRVSGPPCGTCAGEGRLRREEKVKVRIPPGVEDGATLRISGKGDAGRAGGPPGNLLLQVRVASHPAFRREGRDLVCEVPVGVAKAALGGTVEVPTLNGGATVSLPAGTKSGQKLRLRGKGVAAAQGRDAGDLYAVVQIHPPQQLDARSRELLEEFARLNPDPS